MRYIVEINDITDRLLKDFEVEDSIVHIRESIKLILPNARYLIIYKEEHRTLTGLTESLDKSILEDSYYIKNSIHE